MQNNLQFDIILNGLMTRYKTRVPIVNNIISSMIKNNIIISEQDIINDHIAFRTMGVEHLGIQSLEKIFLHYGYVKKDRYIFKKKKLTAYWYAPPKHSINLPRVFISELNVNELSQTAQQIITSYTNEVTQDPVKTLDLNNGTDIDSFLHTPLWRTPTWEDYQTLQQESEYASWVIYNRYYLNHFTISVHALPEPYNDLSTFNTFLESNGILLNDAGGKIKISDDGFLHQSSTVAETVSASFKSTKQDIIKQIPGSYVEFAQRQLMPTGERRDGFEAGNADKIFESTFLKQTKKDNIAD